jgi:DNA-binding MarR family transcriptional regulator
MSSYATDTLPAMTLADVSSPAADAPVADKPAAAAPGPVVDVASADPPVAAPVVANPAAVAAPDHHLVALLGSVREELLEEMYRRVAAAGYPGLRPSHGCVFRYLDLDGSRLADLAEKSGMTKQAFGEHLANVEALGYILRVPDPADGRAKLVVPTPRGRDVLRLGRRAFAEVEREWGLAIGAPRIDALRETLAAILGLQDGGSCDELDPRAGRAPGG